MKKKIFTTRFFLILLFRASILILIASAFFALSTFRAEAEEADPNSFGSLEAVDADLDGDGDISIGACVQKGRQSFRVFLNSVINYSEIYQPILDVVMRNQCQATDILSILNQRDSLRRQIRNAYFTCQNEKIPSLNKGYYRVEAELYYNRGIVDPWYSVNLPFDMLSIDDGVETPRQELFDEMYQLFVVDREWFSRDEFIGYFRILEAKYSNQKQEYITCDENAWEEVSNKWDEFIETSGGVAEGWDDLENAVGRGVDRVVRQATNLTLADHYASMFQLRLNGIEAQKGLGEIYDELEEYYPGGLSELKQEDLVRIYSDEARNFDLRTIRTELATEFELLYKDNGDDTVSLFMEEMDALINNIIDGNAALEKVEDCADEIDARQCSG